MRLAILSLLGGLLMGGPLSGAQERQLVYAVDVPLPIDAAFDMWITPARARQFLAKEVRIDPWVGGRYETLFEPQVDPAGARAGTYGSKVIALEAPDRLVFGWESLTPVRAAEELGGARVFQASEVEVTFEATGPRSTRVRVRHYGFGDDAQWDASFRFYRDFGWPWILGRLEALFAKTGPRP